MADTKTLAQWLDLVESGAEDDVFTAILDAIETLPYKETRIWFSGEGGSNQTKFESKSNRVEIGVIAGSRIAGLALLRLVRYIIDRNNSLESDIRLLQEIDFDGVVRNFDVPMDIKRIVGCLGEREDVYSHSFALNEQPTSTLTGWDKEKQELTKTTYTRTLDKVDIWTVSRVRDQIECVM